MNTQIKEKNTKLLMLIAGLGPLAPSPFLYNNLNNTEAYKMNLTSVKVTPFTTELKDVNNNVNDIRDAVFGEFMTTHGEDEEILNIIYSMWFQPEYWKFQNMDYVKPKIGKSTTYNSKAIAISNNPEYTGILNFKVTLTNSGDITIPKSIVVSGENNEVIVDTIVDNKDRWKGQNGEIITVRLSDYGVDSKQELIDNYSSIVINYNFKHEDNAKHGAREILNIKNKDFSVDLFSIIDHDEWTYPSNITDINAEEVYGDHGEATPKNGLIQRYRKDYTQNKIWAFYAVDSIYDSTSNSLRFRSTSIAGKYRHWGNQANVHSKVTTKINKITIKK